ncbi:MAG: putative amino-acid acetyltransferase [Caulobacteraceae bacterium]|nr:putative amino-acid acetyltransferase [Caulobacteraceae bacterium]
MTDDAQAAPWPPAIELVGRHAIVTPLAPAHAPALAEAVRDGALWKLWYTSVPSPETMETDIAARLAGRERGVWLPFAVVAKASGQPVGMTSYLNIDADNRRLEVGSTWYRRSAQRTAINTECKRMLLAHAFEDLDCIAVEIRTHFFNTPSRRAIERLGAKLDGILRNHSRMPDGTLRDTCVYSIIASEWPTVRRHLDWRLESESAVPGD